MVRRVRKAVRGPERPELWLCLDYGTTQCKAAYEIRLDPHQYVKAKPIRIQDWRTLIPQMMGFIRYGNEFTYYWGHELQRRICDGDYEQEDVFIFESLKEALYISDLQANRLRQINEELERLRAASEGSERYTLEQLLTKHLGCILENALRGVEAQERDRGSYSPDQIRAMPQRWTFTVPEIMTIASNQKYAMIIRAAGFPQQISLVTETEGAGIYLIRERLLLSPSTRNGLEKDAQFIVCDGGGLTVNMIAYNVKDVMLEKNDMAILPLAKRGIAYGSALVTRLCMEHIKLECDTFPARFSGGFLGMCQACQRTPGQLEQRLSVFLETFKTSAYESEKIFTFKGSNAETDDPMEFNFVLTRQDLNGWLAVLYNEIVKTLKEVLRAAPRTRTIIVTGGLFRNSWLMDNLRSYFEARKIHIQDNPEIQIGSSDPAVVNGGLQRSRPGDPVIADVFALGILREEPFDADIHNDITCIASQTIETRDGPYVPDRWCALLPYGDVIESHVAKRTWTAWCTYYLLPSSPVIREEVFIATTQIKDHDAVVVDGELLASVERYKYIEKTIPLQQLRTYEKRLVEARFGPDSQEESSKDGQTHLREDGDVAESSEEQPAFKRRWHYVVTAQLIVTMEGSHIELEMELADPKWKESSGTIQSRPPQTFEQPSFGTDLLHDSKFPSAPQRNKSVQAKPRIQAYSTRHREPDDEPVAGPSTRVLQPRSANRGQGSFDTNAERDASASEVTIANSPARNARAASPPRSDRSHLKRKASARWSEDQRLRVQNYDDLARTVVGEKRTEHHTPRKAT